MNKKNKSLSILAGVVVIAGAAYGVNHYMIRAAQGEIANKTIDLLQLANQDMFDIQLIKSQYHGNSLTQEFGVYFYLDGRRTELPVLVENSATIGLFGSSVDGRLYVNKEKGAGEYYVRRYGTANENFNYTYSTLSGALSVDGKVNFGKIIHYRNRVTPGTIALQYNGDGNTHDLQLHLDAFKISDRSADMKVSNTTLHIHQDVATNAAKVDFSMGLFKFLDTDTYGYDNDEHNIILKNVSLNGSVAGKDKATLNLNAAVDNASLQTRRFQYKDAKAKFVLAADNINLKLLNNIGQEVQKMMTLRRHQRADDLDTLVKAFVSQGFSIKNVQLNVNNSEAKGQFVLQPASYDKVSSYRLKSTVLNNFTGNIKLKLDNALAGQLGIRNDSPMVQRFFTVSKDDIKSDIVFKKGQITANGNSF